MTNGFGCESNRKSKKEMVIGDWLLFIESGLTGSVRVHQTHPSTIRAG
jgi:hypothetical protein